MIGIVIVTHGGLATEFRAALEHIVGPQENFATVAIGAEDDMEMRRKEIIRAVEDTMGEEGLVILTDMFGGTPSNLSISIMEPGKIEVLAGINLPMLIKLASVRTSWPLAQAIEAASASGRKYINIASELLDG